MRPVLAICLITTALPACAADLSAAIDATVRPMFNTGTPGASVIVLKNGQTVFRQAYGMADLDKKQAATPDMAFRLGSITKQFTATAILMLAEQGKLKTSDDIRKYLPGFPDKGKTITIEHLLTHTSGIPSFTGQLHYQANMAKDMTVDGMIATFQDLPLEFTPGERFAYNNSGYFLLGAIIEKVSGMPYADFVAARIFTPLHMRHTAYEGHQRGKVAQVQGYSHTDGKFAPATPLSMTQPYAAGALVSTVDDLARWEHAIAAHKLISQASWKQAFTPYTLAGGKSTGYGYGWEIGTLQGSPTIAHGGGINGFATHGVRLPAEGVYVAVLTNSDSGLPSPEYVASKVAAIAIGKPFVERKAIELDEQALDAFVGTYKVDEKNNRLVTREGKRLYIQRTGGSRRELAAYSSNGFFTPGGLIEVSFKQDKSGKVESLMLTGAGQESISPRTNDAPPAQRPEATLAPGVFEAYIGRYELAPGFILAVSTKDGKYYTQATGQAAEEIFPETDKLFFAKGVEADLRFERGADGSVSRLVLIQGGQEMPAKRLQ
ncbi:serine hydrolase [Pseudoduganella violaceinigra]|uniref:serine hydrolase n=1 Tax=Pseudoduganella violaceinigra TaxID=246602 RepID=UPI0003FBBF57|nr:serine hydrolase [Pseudoduganella violaceinigra]